MRRTGITLSLLLGCLTAVRAENYLINGGQESQISYQMVQKVEPAPGTQKLVLSYVIPEGFASPTYRQNISTFRLTFSIEPSSREEKTDERGNRIVRAIWNRPQAMVESVMQFTASNSTGLKPLRTDAPFPLANLSPVEEVYLAATNQVPARNDEIIRLAAQLTASSKTEFDAIQRILAWVVDHLRYVLVPESYDALYSLRTGKGNCQNYSHISAALMRAVGIPCRIVNGITLKEPYDVELPGGTLTLRMAQGRHSWIEVWFPDLGWVPFDPQQTALYVSNRFIRVEVGLDNEETCNDGLIRWSQSAGAQGRPQFEENIGYTLAADRVNLRAEKQNYGPQRLLFFPPVEARFTPVSARPATPPPPPAPPASQQTMRRYAYSQPYSQGNTDFPRNTDFLAARGPAQQTDDGQMEMRKNFLVETAEYVTTQGQQYAQTFLIAQSLKLNKIGLALHKFGGTGQLWVEIYKDDGSGKPGAYLTTSQYLAVDQMKYTSGYDWVDFDFGTPGLLLPPGRYWMALGFTGSPIINWFFSYGKPVGPEDGTRYKTLFDETWSRSLAYEFNYRIIGMTGE
ncbi:MAG TPA: transglutaminase-like domain-containing protein [bacterium]|nr:transglutaminase-like domain-containing protein [bacterium]HQI48666.1 transglutaminase-like domain-containing protein [bacterium]HQJ64685.1 transglutaminase-like domain-containing protein [bacterium]